jgi:tetratricopeptide (TPR) repeat protein
VRISEEAGLAEGMRHGQLLNNVAVVLNSLQRYEEAAEYYRQGIALYEREGPEHPMLGVMLSNLGEAYIRMGRPADAMVQYKAGLEAIDRALPEDHAYRAFALTGKAWAHLELGEPELAVEILEQALGIVAHKPADPVLVAEAEFLLARALTESAPGDPASLLRARGLAERSRTAVLRHDTAPELRSRVEAWLDAHPE